MRRRRHEDGLSEGALARRMLAAWAALSWERVWPLLWPGLGVAGLFVALALLDVWSPLPGWLHLVLLLLFAGAYAAAIWRPLRRLRLPTRDEAQRRLELKSGLAHRPLALLRDRLATDPEDRGAQALWRAQRRRTARALGRLRVGIPEPGLAERDPLGLRAALGLLLVVGVAAAGLDWPSRLARAFAPDFTTSGVIPAELDGWIAPPEYTGLAPIQLDPGASAQALRVPVGSDLLARVHGGRGVPTLWLDDEPMAFERADGRSHRIRVTISHGERLAVVQDQAELGAWPLDLVPDQHPTVRFAKPPARAARAALRVEYEAQDDYGLVSLALNIRRGRGGEVLAIDLPLPGPARKQANEASFHDLTPHPWAGLPVVLELVAVDGIGQRGLSERLEMVLPERIFNHPVARAVVEQRKALTVDPSRRNSVARVLDALSALPEHFFDDVVVYLALRSARWRLKYDLSESAIAGVQELLWDTALRIEEGPLSLAERELRAAHKALMEALKGDAPDAEIERLMDALALALDNFLRALAEQAIEQAARGEQQALDPNAILLESQDLERLLDQARELSRAGAREAARELLAELQEILENLRAGMMLGAPGSGDERYGRSLRELGDLMRRQQGLLDETFRQSRRPPGAMPDIPGAGPQMAGRQEALRRGLGEIMRRLGEGPGTIPGALGRAERSMLKARRALERGQAGDAVGSQTAALDELRRGTRALIEEMMERLGNLGEGRQGLGRYNPSDRDPLGRRLPGGEWDGGITGDNVKIPDRAELRRAREILDELYRRAGERLRPPPELEYIERLLRRF